MSDPRDEDEEALAWGGDDDPTLVAPSTVPARGAAGSGGATRPARKTVLDEAEDAEDAAAERELAEAEKAGAQLSSVALIAYGILGGIYLLYTIGWVITFTRFEVASLETFDTVTGLISHTLAVAAAPLWFIATLLLTQRRDIRYAFLWLVIGVLVLVPWPFLIGGK